MKHTLNKTVHVDNHPDVIEWLSANGYKMLRHDPVPDKCRTIGIYPEENGWQHLKAHKSSFNNPISLEEFKEMTGDSCESPLVPMIFN